MRTLTDVEIFNQALIRLGQTASFVSAVDGTDTTKFGKVAYPLYFLTRDEELRSGSWQVAVKRAQLAQAMVSKASCSWTSGNASLTVPNVTGILPGWLVTNMITPGGSPPVPPGIPSGTYVVSITDSTHVLMSNQATANGSGTLIFQVENKTGFWYAYACPTDLLAARSVTAVFPNFVYMWPFKAVHGIKWPYQMEGNYFYTDLDPTAGNPVIEYIVELSSAAITGLAATVTGADETITLTTGNCTNAMVGMIVVGAGIPIGATVASWTDTTHFELSVKATTSGTLVPLILNPQTTFEFDFTEALITRLAWKLAPAATGDQSMKKDLKEDYAFAVDRARNNTGKANQSDAPGEAYWTDRIR